VYSSIEVGEQHLIMTAVLLKADILRRHLDVRLGPILLQKSFEVSGEQ